MGHREERIELDRLGANSEAGEPTGWVLGRDVVEEETEARLDVDLGAVAGCARPLLFERSAELAVDEQPSPVGMRERMSGQ